MSHPTAAKGVERQNLMDFKCLQKWKFITLLISVGLSHCGIRGTNRLLDIAFLTSVAGEMGWGGLKPLGDFSYTLIGLSFYVGDGSYNVAIHRGHFCNPRIT